MIIIQARYSSSRLPGKVLLPLEGEAALTRVYKRAKASGFPVLIASTLNKADSVIEEWAEEFGAPLFRGSEEDVLDRYYRASLPLKPPFIARVTSDCPCIDGALSARIINFYLENRRKYDYVSNTLQRSYPHGMDTEVFSFEALERAWLEAKPPHREHVTSYMYKSGLFRCANFQEGDRAGDIRVTLDTKEDYTLLKAVYSLLGADFDYKDIIRLFEKYPWLKEINGEVVQKKVYSSEEEEIADAVTLLKRQDMKAAADILSLKL